MSYLSAATDNQLISFEAHNLFRSFRQSSQRSLIWDITLCAIYCCVMIVLRDTYASVLYVVCGSISLSSMTAAVTYCHAVHQHFLVAALISIAVDFTIAIVAGVVNKSRGPSFLNRPDIESGLTFMSDILLFFMFICGKVTSFLGAKLPSTVTSIFGSLTLLYSSINSW